MRLTEIFNNREIATGIWIVVAIVLGLSKTTIRQAVLKVIESFFKLKILSWLFLMAIYTAGAVTVLEATALWNVKLLKDTIVWFLFTGTAMSFKYVTSENREAIARTILVDNIKVIAIIQFLANTYTFSLLAEIAIVPAVTFIVILDSVSKLGNKYSAVARITEGLLALIGITILVLSAVKAISDYRNLLSFQSVRAFVLPFLLSILFIPFVYAMLLITTYELVFVRLRIGRTKDNALIRYAKRTIIGHIGLNLKQLNLFLKSRALDLIRIETRDDVDALFA
jgi:hypothetical protein